MNQLSAREMLSKQLNGVEGFLSVSFEGDSFEEKIGSIHEMSKNDPHLRNSVHSISRELFDYLKWEVETDPEDIRPLVITTIFIALLRGMVMKTDDPARFHHWLPVAYLHGFEAGGTKSKSVRAEIPSVVFTDNGYVNKKTRDTYFAHQRNEDGGYYNDEIESFFSVIESFYALQHDAVFCKKNAKIIPTLISAFMFVQSVRNPHDSIGFIDGSTQSIISAIIESLDSFPKIVAKIQNMDKVIPFSPYIPYRVRMVRGIKMICVPISRETVIAISEDEISKFEIFRAANSYRKHIIRHAQKNNEIVFGMRIRGNIEL